MTGCAGVDQGTTADVLTSGADAACPLILRLSALDLDARPGAVPSARLHTRAVLVAWGLGQMADAAELVVSELVTNAITAAAGDAAGGVPQPVRLRLSARADSYRVHGVQAEVWDASDQPPQRGRDAPLDEPGGWGLVLVESMSERWGSCPAPGGGKVVWAVLTR
jgi:anti-sigma regulatory factor (Ser/Thr protein kinase)